MAAVEVAGRTALVTGANRGIGKEIVAALVQNGVGKVYAAVRDLSTVAPLREQHGDVIEPVRLNLSDESSINSAAIVASDCEIVICNAGVLRTATVFSDDVYDALSFELEGNLFGFIRVVRAFAQVLKANGGGAIVQMNSIVSMKCFPEFTTYCASKAASYAVTHALNFQLREQGTRVFSVHQARSPLTWVMLRASRPSRSPPRLSPA
ncbi:MAG: SDR family NAD(P)-dependent oxidoreductase [Planctomycetota bacterium]